MIELIYYPIHIPLNHQYIIRKKIIKHNDFNIEDILKKYYAKGLAKWRNDKWGGRIIESYKSKGKLVPNNKYFLLSKNISKTIMVLNTL